MKLKHVALSAIVAPTLFISAHAADVSYNIGAVTLYKSSGVDAEFDEASPAGTGAAFNKTSRLALQGGVDVDLGNGWYVGNWNSTGTFEESNVEVDLYGGYAGEFANGVGYDISYAYYMYPGVTNKTGWNGGEVIGSLSYNGFNLKLSNGLSQYLVNDGKAKRRLSISYTASLTDKVSATVTYGQRNKAGGDYSDFSVAATYDLGNGLSTTATYSGAGKKDEADNHERDNRLVLGISKSF